MSLIQESILINLVSKPLVFINWRNDAFVNYPNEKFSDQFYEIVELDGCWIVDLGKPKNSPVGLSKLWRSWLYSNFQPCSVKSLLNWILSTNQHWIEENLVCVFSCGVVAFVILVKSLALVKTKKFTCRFFKIVAFVIIFKFSTL